MGNTAGCEGSTAGQEGSKGETVGCEGSTAGEEGSTTGGARVAQQGVRGALLMLTSLWKATQADSRSTGSSITTQRSLRASCLSRFIHTDTGTFSPPWLTTST